MHCRLKCNLKLKGINQNIAPWTGKYDGYADAKAGTMVMGADVTHPGKNSGECPSIAAVVATDDEASGRYLASARLQPGKVEVRLRT